VSRRSLTTSEPVFADPKIEALLDRIDDMADGLNNGNCWRSWSCCCSENFAMQDVPDDVMRAFQTAAQTLDPRPFLELCRVTLARPLPEHWKLRS
jgi:hypothetical protein